MCIVDKISFPNCTHTSRVLLFPCKFGFSQDSCNASANIIRKDFSSSNICNQESCRQCYNQTLLSIRTDYASKYLDLEREARMLGWSKADIQGSLMEMQSEMDDAVAEWKANCGREGENDAIKLDAFAESIRFQFGPKPVVESSGKLYFFKAGDDKNFMCPKQTTRVKAVKADRNYRSEILAPWREIESAFQDLLRAQLVV